MTESLEKTNFPIVGTKFRGSEAMSAVKKCEQGDPLELRREPTNAYDPNAVGVWLPARDPIVPEDGAGIPALHVGYIPQVMNAQIARLLDEGVALRATFDSSEIGKARLNIALPAEDPK